MEHRPPLRLVPKISSLDAFCDTAAAGAGAAGIGDSRSWIGWCHLLQITSLDVKVQSAILIDSPDDGSCIVRFPDPLAIGSGSGFQYPKKWEIFL